MTRSVKLKRKYERGDYAARRYRVTLFLPQGMYPQGTFCTPNGIFHADPDIVFAVTFGVPWQATSEHLPYSEVDWLLPEVVRLLGSLIMTEPFSGLRNRFYPLAHGGFTLNEEVVDLTRPETALAVKRALLRTVGSLGGKLMQANGKPAYQATSIYSTRASYASTTISGAG